MVAGTPPIRAKKARYYEDARFRDRVLPPPTPSRGPTVQHDDWTALPLPRPQEEGTGGGTMDEGRDDDPTGSEHRHQPELSRVKAVEKMQPIENEFEFDTDRDDEMEDVATRNRRITGLMQGVARQVSLNPNDGMEL